MLENVAEIIIKHASPAQNIDLTCCSYLLIPFNPCQKVTQVPVQAYMPFSTASLQQWIFKTLIVWLWMNESSRRQHVLDYLHTQFDGISYCVNPLRTTYLHSYEHKCIYKNITVSTVVYMEGNVQRNVEKLSIWFHFISVEIKCTNYDRKFNLKFRENGETLCRFDWLNKNWILTWTLTLH